MAAPAEEETVLQGRDLPAIFRLWEEKHSTPGFDPVIILTRYVSIFVRPVCGCDEGKLRPYCADIQMSCCVRQIFHSDMLERVWIVVQCFHVLWTMCE